MQLNIKVDKDMLEVISNKFPDGILNKICLQFLQTCYEENRHLIINNAINLSTSVEHRLHDMYTIGSVRILKERYASAIKASVVSMLANVPKAMRNTLSSIEIENISYKNASIPNVQTNWDNKGMVRLFSKPAFQTDCVNLIRIMRAKLIDSKVDKKENPSVVLQFCMKEELADMGRLPPLANMERETIRIGQILRDIPTIETLLRFTTVKRQKLQLLIPTSITCIQPNVYSSDVVEDGMNNVYFNISVFLEIYVYIDKIKIALTDETEVFCKNEKSDIEYPIPSLLNGIEYTIDGLEIADGFRTGIINIYTQLSDRISLMNRAIDSNPNLNEVSKFYPELQTLIRMNKDDAFFNTQTLFLYKYYYLEKVRHYIHNFEFGYIGMCTATDPHDYGLMKQIISAVWAPAPQGGGKYPKTKYNSFNDYIKVKFMQYNVKNKKAVKTPESIPYVVVGNKVYTVRKLSKTKLKDLLIKKRQLVLLK